MNVTNVLVDVDSLKVLDYGRPKLPYELEINNVDVDSITDKLVFNTVSRIKVDAQGNTLYALPQPDKQVTEDVSVQVETTEITGNPIMLTQTTKVPLLDDKGNQVVYVEYGEKETTDKFDPNTGASNPPILVDGVQQTDSSGNPLYTETYIVKTTKCYTVEESQVQKIDSQGNKLFYKNETQTVVVQTLTNQYKEITKDDTDYVEGLNPAVEEVQEPNNVSFSTNFQDYTYSDILLVKEQQLLVGTLYSNSLLFELFQQTDFDPSNTVADFVVDKLSLPIDGKATTTTISLPKLVNAIKVITETNISGITIKVNGTQLNSKSEVWLPTSTNSVIVEIDNPTGKRVDINSLAILS